MLKLRFMERPTIATTRPLATAASTTCCSRWMCDEKVVMITRPGASRTIARSEAPTVRSEAVEPGTSALVESAISSATPASPSALEPVELGGPIVDRGRIELEVSGVHDRPELGVERDRDRVGHRVGDAHELHRERADLHSPASGLISTRFDVRRQAVLVELRLDQAERATGCRHTGARVPISRST